MTLTIFSAITSPSEPPKTVKSWLKTKTVRPSISPVAGDDGVAPGPVLLHLEVVGAVADEGVELLERPRVEQLLDPLAGGELALRVLLLDRRLRGRVDRRVAQLAQVAELLLEGLGALLAHPARQSKRECRRAGRRSAPILARVPDPGSVHEPAERRPTASLRRRRRRCESRPRMPRRSSGSAQAPPRSGSRSATACIEQLGVEAEVERVAQEGHGQQQLPRVGAIAGVRLGEVRAHDPVLDRRQEPVGQRTSSAASRRSAPRPDRQPGAEHEVGLAGEDRRDHVAGSAPARTARRDGASRSRRRRAAAPRR